METETIAARNVVEMVLRERFALPGLCATVRGPSAGHQEGDGERFVYGWDCPVSGIQAEPL